MVPDPRTTQSLPSPWAKFLDEVDKLLSAPVQLHCLGGFVLTVLYGTPRPTGDIDYILAVPTEQIEALQEIAGAGSRLSKRYKVHVQYVGVHEVPEDYEERLQEIFPSRFRHLQLLALEAHDIALSKLTRNTSVDREDVKFLAKTVPLDENVLKERYERELRPNLSNQERHDLTLRLWLEDYFQ